MAYTDFLMTWLKQLAILSDIQVQNCCRMQHKMIHGESKPIAIEIKVGGKCGFSQTQKRE